jgi:lincosamide nucleotidyltransferase A/C/D/E
VLAILDALTGEDVPAWVHGGWGVDALLGDQTRDHDDLDLITQLADVPRIRTILAKRGFTMVRGESHTNFVLADDRGREIDFHPVSWDGQGNALYVNERGQKWTLRPADLMGVGSILGQPVACLTPEIEMATHSGYDLQDNDQHDIEALHQRFGLEYPTGYPRGRR